MLSAGDVQSYLRKLESLLRGIKYPGHVDYDGLCKGDPSAFLPIMSFTLTTFSLPFAEQLMAAGLELSSKTDLRFTDTVYKVLRDVFHYKPVLSKQQFLQRGFSQRKVSFLCDVIDLVLQRHHQLKKVMKKPLVASRLENHSAFTNPPEEEPLPSHDAACASHTEVYSSGSSGQQSPDLPGGGGSTENILCSSEVEARLSALEAQLQDLLPALHKLDSLEKRLEEVEKCKTTDKSDGPFITISRDSWENMMSRIVLLETKDELRNPQMSVSLQSQPSSSHSLSSISEVSQGEIKERLERITTMLKNSSGLLKNTESFTSTCK